MGEEAEEILKRALKLSASDRARVAAELIASVEMDANPDIEAAWVAEIERRIERVRTEGVQGDDWETVRARLEKKFRAR